MKLTDVGLQLALRRISVSTTRDSLAASRSGLQSCIADCAEWIHNDNRERGWWTDLHTGHPLSRNVGELLMLMVSEIAEIPDKGLLSVVDDKLPDRLMFEVELADTVIRILDTAGALAPHTWTGFVDAALVTESCVNAKEVDVLLMEVVRALANAMEGHRKKQTTATVVPGQHIPLFDYWLGRALHQTFYIGALYELHVPEAIMEKLRFNARRADHQLEHRRAAGGKAY